MFPMDKHRPVNDNCQINKQPKNKATNTYNKVKAF